MARSQGLSLPAQCGLRRQAAELTPVQGMNGLRVRLSFRLVSLVICALSMIASYTAPARAETALRIASSQVSIASIPVVVAIQQKLFQAEGISAEIVDFDGGGP